MSVYPDRYNEDIITGEEAIGVYDALRGMMKTSPRNLWEWMQVQPYKDGFWDDLRFPATAFNPPGEASDPTIDITDGTFLFGPTLQSLLFVVAQFPHDTLLPQVIHPHIHWAKTTSAAGNAAWYYRYKTARIGELITSFSANQVSHAVALGDDDTAQRHLITQLPQIDLEALNFGLSDTLIIEFGRLGANTDPLDTYGADAKFLEFDIHYKRDLPGSVGEFTK